MTNLIYLNNISGSYYVGIKIDSSSDNRVFENKLDKSGNFSILCTDSDNLNISWNNATNTNDTGIYVVNCDATEIWKNIIVNNTNFGIYLDQSANCKINNNTLYNNTICIGVHLSTCPNLESVGNTCAVYNLDTSNGGNGNPPPAISGYALIFIVGMIGAITTILIRKKKSQIKIN